MNYTKRLLSYTNYIQTRQKHNKTQQNRLVKLSTAQKQAICSLVPINP